MADHGKGNPFYFGRKRSEMLAFLPNRATRVLEIGCGDADFGAAVREKFDCEVWGIEPHTPSIGKAEARIDRVLNGTFEDVVSELPAAYFDLLVCNDVIEHMADPERFLQQVAPSLTMDAHLVVSLPNVRYWKCLWELVFRKRWRYAEAGVMDKTHLRFFTQWTILDLFKRCDYEFVRFAGINRSRSFRPLPVVVASLGYFRDILYPQYGMLLKRSSV